MDIKTQTPEQLKALAYDQLVILEQTKNNIAIIQAELQSRNVEPQPVEDAHPVPEKARAKKA